MNITYMYDTTLHGVSFCTYFNYCSLTPLKTIIAKRLRTCELAAELFATRTRVQFCIRRDVRDECHVRTAMTWFCVFYGMVFSR